MMTQIEDYTRNMTLNMQGIQAEIRDLKEQITNQKEIISEYKKDIDLVKVVLEEKTREAKEWKDIASHNEDKLESYQERTPKGIEILYDFFGKMYEDTYEGYDLLKKQVKAQEKIINQFQKQVEKKTPPKGKRGRPPKDKKN